MAWAWHDDWPSGVCSWCVQMYVALCKSSNRISLRKCPYRQHMHSVHVMCVCTLQQQIDMSEACFLDLVAMLQLFIQLERACVWMCVCVIIWGAQRAFGGCKAVVRPVERLKEQQSFQSDNTDSTIPMRISHVNNQSANSQLQSHYNSWPVLTYTNGYEKVAHITGREIM